jgi:phage FluMu protein Com
MSGFKKLTECLVCELEYLEEEHAECPRCAELNSIKRPELVSEAAITARLTTPKQGGSLGKHVGKIWPNNDTICYKLISEVERKFAGKNKFNSFLKEDNSFKSQPNILKDYISKYDSDKNKNQNNFITLVNDFMDKIVIEARSVRGNVTGGSIVFMHYKSIEPSDKGRLLAIMVDKKEGFDFDDINLIPKDADHINLDNLRQAALFDLTLFDECYPNIPENETYLKFIKGSSQANFFKHAFGCDEKHVDNVKSIKEIRKALAKFTEKHKLGGDFYTDASEKIEENLLKAKKTKIPASANSIYKDIESVLHTSHSHLKDTFSNFVLTNGFEVNHHIEPTENSIKDGQCVILDAEDKSYSGKVKKDSIGKSGSGSIVTYQDGKLTFEITNPETRKELELLIKENSDE